MWWWWCGCCEGVTYGGGVGGSREWWWVGCDLRALGDPNGCGKRTGSARAKASGTRPQKAARSGKGSGKGGGTGGGQGVAAAGELSTEAVRTAYLTACGQGEALLRNIEEKAEWDFAKSAQMQGALRTLVESLHQLVKDSGAI